MLERLVDVFESVAIVRLADDVNVVMNLSGEVCGDADVEVGIFAEDFGVAFYPPEFVWIENGKIYDSISVNRDVARLLGIAVLASRVVVCDDFALELEALGRLCELVVGIE